MTTQTSGLVFHTPRANQNQTVLVSYAAADGMVVRRTVDRSDRTAEYAISHALNGDQGNYWDVEPSNRRWRELTTREQRHYGLEA